MDERENQIKRIKPQNLAAEQTVIGSMLMDNECIPSLESILSGEDFYNRQNGVIFDAIVELYNEGKPVDTVTLSERLSTRNLPPGVADLAYLNNLVAEVPLSSNAKYYAEIVSEKSVLRHMIKVGEDVENDCYADNERLDDIMENAEKRFYEVLSRKKNMDYKPIQEITMTALEKINEAARSKNPITGLPTGFKDLDELLTGLHPSELILIAARPSMGKTALVLNILQNVVLEQDKCAAFFSLEMSGELIMNRLFALESHVDAQRIRSGDLSDSDWDKLLEGAEAIGRSQLIIDDTPGISVAEMRSKCRKFKLDHDIKLIVIDYLQLMSPSGKRNENRQQEITEISRSLKALAREMNVPVIALSQLSRAPDTRADHRPMLSDLRESGSIEQDADVVMFIYRDEYYNKEESKAKGVTELIVAKQRNGPVDTVRLAWLPQYTKFGNISRDAYRTQEDA